MRPKGEDPVRQNAELGKHQTRCLGSVPWKLGAQAARCVMHEWCFFFWYRTPLSRSGSPYSSTQAELRLCTGINRHRTAARTRTRVVRWNRWCMAQRGYGVNGPACRRTDELTAGRQTEVDDVRQSPCNQPTRHPLVLLIYSAAQRRPTQARLRIQLDI